MSAINWNHGNHSGLVSIGTHELHLSISGPSSPSSPSPSPTPPPASSPSPSPSPSASNPNSRNTTTIILPGVTNSSLPWTAVARLTSASTRVLLYDRSGYHLSSISPLPPSPSNIAHELLTLLHTTAIQPPYILLAHSWGGIILREVLALLHNQSRWGEIAGVILVDANQPRTNTELPWMDPVFAAVHEGLDWVAVQEWEARTALNQDEWEAFVAELESKKHKVQAGRERAEVGASYAACGEKMRRLRRSMEGHGCGERPLLGRRPVCVVKGHAERDLRRAFDAGVKRGNGTEGERRRYAELLEGWEERDTVLQREALEWSSTSRWMEAERAGHDVELVEPEIIVRAVRWVLDNMGV